VHRAPGEDAGGDSSTPRRRAAVVAAAAFSLVLIPYGTLGLSFRTALYVQAAAILAVVSIAGLLGLALGGRPWSRGLPLRLGLGLALYGGAAGLAAAVGLAAGNSPELVSGQLLSMGLLPLAGVAGLTLDPPRTWRAFGTGALAAAAAAAAFHLAAWALAAGRGRPALRLFLDNSVSLSGLALIALMLGLAAARGRDARIRALAWGGLALLALYLLGAAVRGLWIAALPSLGAFVALKGAGAPRARAATATGVALLVLLALVWWCHRWLARERPDLLAGGRQQAAVDHFEWTAADPSQPGEGILARVAGPAPVPGRGTYRLSARVGGGATGTGLVAIRWRNGWGDPLGIVALSARPFARMRRLEAVSSPPAGTATAELVVGARGGSTGSWSLAGPRLEFLGPSLPTVLVAQAAYLDMRLRSLAALVSAPGSPPDVSVASRMSETRVVLGLFAAASWPRRLLGHGLGATFRPEGAPVAPAPGERGDQNYVHNFYAFLLWKLGLVGTALVAAALGLWLAMLVAWARGAPAGPRRSFLAAASGAWVGCLALAVSSPEILNFRVAPVLGLLLAAAAGAAGSEPGGALAPQHFGQPLLERPGRKP
jgi:hypothetical protein